MLSIRRRPGQYGFREEAFGQPEHGWPKWGELGPILLRSAGIVGIAGVIMVITAGDALFNEPRRTPRAQSAGLVQSPQGILRQETIVTGTIPAAAVSEAAEASSGVLDAAAPPVRARVPVMAPAEPEALLDGPAPESALVEALPPSIGNLTDIDAVRSSGRTDIGVAAFSASGHIEDDAANAETKDDLPTASPWARVAVDCPRDWLHGADPDFAGELSADCKPKLVLVAAVPSLDVEEASGEPALDEALETAAATEALTLAGFVARLPIPRPDPPPVQRVRSDRRADWPDAPPPNCGQLHAYWRFVDREKGIKEWYCR